MKSLLFYPIYEMRKIVQNFHTALRLPKSTTRKITINKIQIVSRDFLIKYMTDKEVLFKLIRIFFQYVNFFYFKEQKTL